MVSLFPRQRKMWRKYPLKDKYDVVIVGAGVHGLAAAYYLAKRGVTNVAVLEKGYLGCGNSGRNTAIIRANYRTLEGVPFYNESVRLYEQLSEELDFNLLFSQHGHLTLAHTDSSVNGLRLRAELNKQMGVESRMISPKEIKALIPAIDISDEPHLPIMAALYHPPGGTIRHDAVVWGYASAADRLGIEIHPHTEVIGIGIEDHRVTNVKTNRGEIKTDTVLNATSGWSSIIAKMADIEIPVSSHPLQACVSEPLKPVIEGQVVVSANLHVYIYQTERGEIVIGSEIDSYSTYSIKSTLPTLEMMATYTLELFPCVKEASVLRQWAGTCDMTPDYSPIMGKVDGLKGFILDCGWGTYGFKTGPVSGKCIAELIATGETPELIKPFSLSRFYEDRLISEKAAAAVSH
ncbi:MAG: FAD-dependent oxidoreductase [Candidatus Bathyarchaeia archaeon]